MEIFLKNYKILSFKVKDGNQAEYYDYLDKCDQLWINPKAQGILRNWVLDGNLDIGGFGLGDKYS